MLIVGGGYVACEFAEHHERARHPGDHALPRRPDPARLRRRPARPRGRGDARPRHRARDPSATCAAIERPATGCGSRLDNGEAHLVDQVLFATGRDAEHRGSRARGARASASRANGAVRVDAWSQTAVPSIYRGRRRHRPAGADPGGDPRGPGLRRDGVRGAAGCAPTTAGRRRRSSPGPRSARSALTEAEARAAGGSRSTAARFRPMLNMLAGPRRAHADEAGGRARRAAACSAATSSAHGAAEMVQLAAVAIRHGGDQGGLRPHDGGASDGGRGAGHDADRGGVTS